MGAETEGQRQGKPAKLAYEHTITSRLGGLSITICVSRVVPAGGENFPPILIYGMKMTLEHTDPGLSGVWEESFGSRAEVEAGWRCARAMAHLLGNYLPDLDFSRSSRMEED